MAGFTDFAFRAICKRFGADVMLTEFVHAEKFLNERSEESAWQTVDFSADQRPMGVQIFGGDPDRMADAAVRIVDKLQPDFIDINYGCPAPRVVRNACGSSLLREPNRLQAIAAAVVNAVSTRLPVTAKIRIGWDATSINAVDNARRLQDAGIEALTIHGRTKEQGYRGTANWNVIEQVAQQLAIPVIGNGSLSAGYDLSEIRSFSAVRGLMIGRMALGNPWVFRELKSQLAGVDPMPAPTAADHWQLLLEYAELLVAHRTIDDSTPIHWARSKLKSFARDFAGSKALRGQLEKVGTMAELREICTGGIEASAQGVALNS